MLKIIFMGLLINFVFLGSNSFASTTDEICIIDAIIHEAGGEIDDGKIGVAYVIKNRSLTTGNSFCNIVHERYNGRYQFSFMASKHTLLKNTSLWQKAKNIVHAVIYNEIKDITEGSQFFHRCSGFSSQVSQKNAFKFIKKIGNHCYYKDKKKTDKYSDLTLYKAKHFNPALHIPEDMLNNT